MIFFDTTKTGGRRRRSGLDRVSSRLRAALGPAAREVIWRNGLRDARSREPVHPAPDDAFVTSELFSEPERPGFTAWLASRPCVTAAIFHDAIPLQLPHITWPQSVARHPAYMKLLARFDRVLAVSRQSRSDLLGFWKWQGVEQPPPVSVLALGADFQRTDRVQVRRIRPPFWRPGYFRPEVLCVGILEPRKNQSLLLNVCADLWSEGTQFELHIVGRVNPHFGKPILAQLKALQNQRIGMIRYHEAASDAAVLQRYANARVTVFPTLAEGCGLPLLESLWLGAPCVCSDLPVLREHGEAGGCVFVPPNDRAGWTNALRRILNDDAYHHELVISAMTRALPTWEKAARSLVDTLQPAPATLRP